MAWDRVGLLGDGDGYIAGRLDRYVLCCTDVMHCGVA